MHLDVYLGLQHRIQAELESAFLTIAEHHGGEPDVHVTCDTLAEHTHALSEQLEPFVQKYGQGKDDGEAEDLYEALFKGPRSGGVGLLRDLQDVYLLASMSDITWQMLRQAALGLRDPELGELCACALAEGKTQLAWLLTRMKAAAPQALIVAA
jgi:hypothetical protein